MLEAFGLSDPGCIRHNNEDYYRLVPEIDLYVVADGMGGAQAGEHASKLAVDTVVDYVLSAKETSGEVLLDALQEANRKVLAAAGSEPTLQGMGTTLTVCWKVADELLIANVG
ncbi:MAG TPA: protein phosphatase 2C domain-containing protein, partial [Bryobacteraceae bacterium]|nr:protein phosphatase 2C domain-containing protein [Bryobacteraceae bacterium]